MPAICSVAVFAHNEANRIADTARSVLLAGAEASTEVVILANGCRDHTAAVARKLASLHPNLHVVEIAVADKANAWNHYVHEIAAASPFREAQMHVFVDGDVRVQAGSFEAFATAFEQHPSANAVGALPLTGRDREAWTRRMLVGGTLAGGLYALSGSFLDRIRRSGIRIPQGLIGEDWLVSLLAGSDLRPLLADPHPASHLLFAANAGFSFRSLSPWRLRDYRTYLRRLWRYSLRSVQFEMLAGWLLHRHPGEMPANVEDLYRLGTPPSRLKWVGATSILRTLAVQKVRLVRASGSK